MCSDFGAFGKLFSEAIETADRKPVEGVLSAGGSHLHGVRFGLLPQVLPVIASQVLYYFESNTRSATIIGIVGAGGIGLHLSEQIRTLEWQHVSFIILLILLAVASIDFPVLTSALRYHRPQARQPLGAPRGIVAVHTALKRHAVCPRCYRWFNGLDPDDLVTIGRPLVGTTLSFR